MKTCIIVGGIDILVRKGSPRDSQKKLIHRLGKAPKNRIMKSNSRDDGVDCHALTPSAVITVQDTISENGVTPPPKTYGIHYTGTANIADETTGTFSNSGVTSNTKFTNIYVLHTCIYCTWPFRLYI